MFLASLLAAVLLAGWHGGRVAMLVGGTLVVAWVTAAVLIQTDYRGVGGFMECRSSCTAEDTVGFVIFYSPVLLVVLLVGRLAGWLTRRGSA